MPLYRLNQSSIRRRDVRFLEPDIEHHRLGAVFSEPIYQSRMQPPVPQVPSRLLIQPLVRLLVHIHDRYFVGHDPRPEGERNVIAEIRKRFPNAEYQKAET